MIGHRRDKRMTGDAAPLLAALAVALAVAPAPTPAQDEQTAQIPSIACRRIDGVVYWDHNANGQRDEGEAGIGGVRVVANFRTATTDAEGRYDLASDKPILVVSLGFPSGTWPTTSWFQRPQGASVRGVDFGLRKDEQSLPLVFVQMTDTHGNLAWAGQTIPAELTDLSPQPKFYVVTGDLGGGNLTVRKPDDLRRSFSAIAEDFKNFPAPVFMVPGNHETVGYGSAGKIEINAEDLRHPWFGAGAWEWFVCPSHWSFSCAGVRFIAFGWGEYVDGGWRTPSETILRWIDEERLAAGPSTHSVLLAHDPGRGDIVESKGLSLGLFGHTHTEGLYFSPGKEKPNLGEKTLTSGMTQPPRDTRTGARKYAQDGRPTGYRVVVVEADRIDTFYKPLGEPHAILLNEPRRFQAITAPESFMARGQIFDPLRQVKDVEVLVDGRRVETKVTPRRFWSDFEAQVATTEMDSGFATITLKATWPDGAFLVTEPYLILTGREGKHTAAAAARLEATADIQGQPARVLVNGVAIGEVPASQGKVSLEIPAPALKRLNEVRLEAPSSKSALKDVTLLYDGQPYRDQHRISTWGYQPNLTRDSRMFFDLKHPGPSVQWRVQKAP